MLLTSVLLTGVHLLCYKGLLAASNSDTEAGCKLPPQPLFGQYKLAGCKPPCQPVPGDTVSSKSFLIFTCFPGYELLGSTVVLCDGVWNPEFPTCSRITCPPLENPTRGIKCTLNDNKVLCDRPMAPGTVAWVKCKTDYNISINELYYFVTICQSDRSWSREVFPCTAIKCPALVNPTRDIECERNKRKVNCDQPMDPGTKAVVQCNASYTNKKELADFDTTCQSNGSWSHEVNSCIPRTCPALVNPSREIRCKRNDEKVECDQPMIPGTKALVSCELYYTNVIELADFETTCQSDGSWSREVHSCVSKCGEPNPVAVTSIASEANYNEFPWHAGVYRMEQGRYIQVCGGSIISERAIITAAQCFWNSSAGSPIDYKDFRVAVGKIYRDWNNTKDIFVQVPEITSVVLHDKFRGDALNWENDVAVIKLKESLKMNLAIRPICMDYNRYNERFFLPGKVGIVMGWTATENQTSSEKLLKTYLPYVELEVCARQVPPSFVRFLTRNKICAGFRNGTTVCSRDSGSGYATQFRDGKWYLMGIVSLVVPTQNVDSCNLFQYTLITRLSEYYTFIQRNA